MRRGLSLIAAAVLLATMTTLGGPAGAQSLDYAYFKAKVEPIFLKKRCGSCQRRRR